MSFGLPYMGSKSKLADWILDEINPLSDLFCQHKTYSTFVDVFFGGGAISHYALLYRNFDTIIANDITPTALLFKRLLNNEIDLDKYIWISREEFRKNKELDIKEQDQIIGLVYSFGNNRQDYLYSKETEEEKKFESKRNIINGSFTNDILAEHIQRLNRIYNITKIRKSNKKTNFIAECQDYRELEIPNDSLVYLDPPYKDSRAEAYYDKRISTFNLEELYSWAESLVLKKNCDVFMSERVAPSYYEEVSKKDYYLNFRKSSDKEKDDNKFKISSVEKIFKIVPRKQDSYSSLIL